MQNDLERKDFILLEFRGIKVRIPASAYTILKDEPQLIWGLLLILFVNASIIILHIAAGMKYHDAMDRYSLTIISGIDIISATIIILKLHGMSTAKAIIKLERSITNAISVMKFARIAMGEFNAEQFDVFYKLLINSADKGIRAVNYIDASKWNSNQMRSSVRFIGEKIGFFEGEFIAHRIFIVDSADEADLLMDVIDLHTEAGINALLISKEDAIRCGMKEPIERTFVIADDTAVGVFELKDRQIKSMHLESNENEVRNYEKIYSNLLNRAKPAASFTKMKPLSSRHSQPV